MTILHSCCCWRSVRKGSFACGVYTAIYYTVNAAHTSALLHHELELLECTQHNCSGELRRETIIDKDQTSQSSVTFTIISLSLSSSGILFSCLLLYGLHRDIKLLLIPWILNLILFISQDVTFVLYKFIEHAITLNPPLAILVTIDLFLTALNVYALLCVISQYQELKAGRGRAIDDQLYRVPNIQYSSQPTATSYLSTKRPITYQETRPTPTQSPTGTAPHTSLGTDEASPSNFNKGPRKSVKFDHSSPLQNGPQLLEPWTIEVKSPMLVTKAGDTAPLIETNNTDNMTVLQSNL